VHLYHEARSSEYQKFK